MKMPKYIGDALKRRERALDTFIEADHLIADWCKKYNIGARFDYTHLLDYLDGSTIKILEAIMDKKA